VKDFRDAYVSPAKDLPIVMTGTELWFCEFVEGMPFRDAQGEASSSRIDPQNDDSEDTAV